jgi:succinate-acetate transporter protein
MNWKKLKETIDSAEVVEELISLSRTIFYKSSDNVKKVIEMLIAKSNSIGKKNMEHTSEKKANPAPLGLLGFGMTTVLLNLHNAQIIELSVVIVAMGFAMGGTAQIIAGIFELKLGNTFGGTAFTSYGFFWWSLCLIWINPFSSSIQSPSNVSMSFYLLLWGIFTLFMFFGTLKHNRANQCVFLSLAVLFFLLAAADFLENDEIKIIAGYEGIFCGASAIYSALAQIVNGEFGKKIFPL